jgi:hypothetical protein
MKGTILDFLRLAAEKPELARELVELAGKHDFEFTDEVSDEDLEEVTGGLMSAFLPRVPPPPPGESLPDPWTANRNIGPCRT